LCGFEMEKIFLWRMLQKVYQCVIFSNFGNGEEKGGGNIFVIISLLTVSSVFLVYISVYNLTMLSYDNEEMEKA